MFKLSYLIAIIIVALPIRLFIDSLFNNHELAKIIYQKPDMTYLEYLIEVPFNFGTLIGLVISILVVYIYYLKNNNDPFSRGKKYKKKP